MYPSDTQTQKNENTNKKLKARTGRGERPESQPLNEDGVTGIGIGEAGAQKPRDVGSQALFRRLKQSPEVLSLVQAMIDDIIGPGASFTYTGREDGDNNGDTSIKRAKKFWEQNQETYATGMIDHFVVGDMYMYKRSVDEAQVRESVRDILRNDIDMNYKSNIDLGTEMLLTELKEQTDMFDIEELTHVPATTVEHVVNDYGDVTQYRQKAGQYEVELPGDQVIHDSFMKLDGKTYGFAPFRSLFTEIDMLANAKNHNAQIFSNAGIVNKMFILPDEGPGDQNFEMVKKTISKFRQMRNKHRDLVLTGDINVEDMNGQGQSMEFRQLAEYISNVLAMAWGVPPSRVGADVGGGGKRGRATQLSHEGYFKRIKRLQNKHQAVLNEQLFEPVFNVRIEFNNPDTKQEIREADRDLRRLDVTKQMVALGLWGKESAMSYMDVNRTEVNPDFDEEAFQARAMEISGLQDEVLDDETVNGDTAEDAERMDLREGEIEQERRNDGINNDS